jgi:hypothetical protein
MKFIKNISLYALAGLLLLLASCDKTEPYEIAIPPSQAHFIGDKDQKYFVESNTQVYNVVIGTTSASDRDRVVKFQITSPSGAVPGTQYSIDGVGADGNGSVIIKAGKVLSNISINADSTIYATGRKDTLIFNIIDSEVKTAGFSNQVILVLKGPCFEGNVNLQELFGTYSETNEVWGSAPYGPYQTAVSAFTSTGPTSGTITVNNIFNYGWAPITFKLDWSDPFNRKVTLDQQENIAVGSTLGAPSVDDTYQVMVRAYVGEFGTFSVCSQKITLKMQIGAKDPGGIELWDDRLYTVEMSKD